VWLKKQQQQKKAKPGAGACRSKFYVQVVARKENEVLCVLV
jgi:hypothetical protein